VLSSGSPPGRPRLLVNPTVDLPQPLQLPLVPIEAHGLIDADNGDDEEAQATGYQCVAFVPREVLPKRL